MHIPKTKNSIATLSLVALMSCSNPSTTSKNFQKVAQDTVELTSKTYKLPFYTKILDVSSDFYMDLVYKNDLSSTKELIKTLEGGEQYAVTKNGQKYYQVYYGKADKMADKANLKKGLALKNLLTVGHGHSQRDFIELSGGQKLKEGGLITAKQADSLLNADLKAKEHIIDSLIQKPLQKHQRTAILSYLINVDYETLCKKDSTRKISESFFECINKGELGKAQSKFNIITAGGIEHLGLMQRRLIEMVIFGNGKIENDPNAQQSFSNLVKKINAKGSITDINYTLQILKNSGIPETKIKNLKNKMLTILHPQN